MIKNVKGFTLVEILVAVGVLAVATLAFLPSFSKSYKEKSLQKAMDAVKDATTTARNSALTEVGNPGAEGTARFVYSGVKFERDSGEYILFRSTDATSDICVNLPEDSAAIDSTKTLPNDIVARIAVAAESPLCVFFEYGTGVSIITRGSSDATSCTDE